MTIFSHRWIPILIIAVLTGYTSHLRADEDLARLKEKPITSIGGEVGKLLSQWWKEGTAAGNAGDFYDNRDGGHSDLNMTPFPQLQKIIYTPEDVKLRRHWAGQRVILPKVVFGNSSTSAPLLMGGSNVRMYYSSPAGLPFLYKQYTSNNIYIYPEHRDHDPGHNGFPPLPLGEGKGEGGYGDVYPTNTPYLIASQGSSGSDQPFMRAMPLTLAAFRPDVKKKLTETGLLMPTLQMILRSTYKPLKDPKEYLTGKAHPTVFEGSGVNDLAMIKLAHGIELENIPPMIHLKVLEEEQVVLGKDYFEPKTLYLGKEPGEGEKWADTPGVVARIFRGREKEHRLLVSAESSYDVNKRPLTFTWVVLRGDADKIKIVPKNKDNSVAELVVSYHERRPIAPGSTMESNRVDIGVFVHNGHYYSAPGFVTFFTLDHEARTYDEKGRILEIGQGMGETHLTVANWPEFFKQAGAETPAARLLPLKPDERDYLKQTGQEYQRFHGAIEEARMELKTAEARRKELKAETGKADAEVQAAQKKLAQATKEANQFLDQKQGQNPPVRVLVDRTLRRVVENPNFSRDHAPVLDGLLKNADAKNRTEVQNALKRLPGFGLLQNPDGSFSREPTANALPQINSQPAWTAYEKMLLERVHATLLSHILFPGAITQSFQVNYVDHRLSTPKNWRDLFHYHENGILLGWTRYDGDKAHSFNADGHLILEKDMLGRCIKAQAVRYIQDPPKNPKTFEPNRNPLRWVGGQELIVYEFDGDKDYRGKIKSREKLEK